MDYHTYTIYFNNGTAPVNVPLSTMRTDGLFTCWDDENGDMAAVAKTSTIQSILVTGP